MENNRDFIIALIGFMVFVFVACTADTITNEKTAANATNINSATETNEIVKGKPDDDFLKEQPEQKYIVRYAHLYDTTDDGVIYEDDNGNLWEVSDPPEISGDVRLLFDSNETVISTDDVIIDITEAK